MNRKQIRRKLTDFAPQDIEVGDLAFEVNANITAAAFHVLIFSLGPNELQNRFSQRATSARARRSVVPIAIAATLARSTAVPRNSPS